VDAFGEEEERFIQLLAANSKQRDSFKGPMYIAG
jgi:hypothetical protein